MNTSCRLYSENYYALAVSILKNVPSEQAFFIMREGPKARKRGFSDKEIHDMINLRKSGEKYKDIGALFDTSASSICTIIRRYKKRMEKTRLMELPLAKLVAQYTF